MKTVMRFLLPVLLAVVCVAQVRRSSELTKAQHLLWSVERRTLAILRGGAIDKVKLTGNIAALTDAQKLDPAEVAIPTLIGSEYLILGKLEPYAQIPWFWSDQYDLKLQFVGFSADNQQVVVRGDPESRSFAAL